jgi:ribosomal protein L37AE/L43A
MIEGLDDLIVVIGGDAATNERVKRAIVKKMADTYTCFACGVVEAYEDGVVIDGDGMVCRKCEKEVAG